jgi:hypothetical protein
MKTNFKIVLNPAALERYDWPLIVHRKKDMPVAK